jgi:hypothetical protein
VRRFYEGDLQTQLPQEVQDQINHILQLKQAYIKVLNKLKYIFKIHQWFHKTKPIGFQSS